MIEEWQEANIMEVRHRNVTSIEGSSLANRRRRGGTLEGGS